MVPSATSIALVFKESMPPSTYFPNSFSFFLFYSIVFHPPPTSVFFSLLISFSIHLLYWSLIQRSHGDFKRILFSFC